MHTTVLYNGELSGPKCQCAKVEAEVEKPGLAQIDLCPVFKVLLRDCVLIHCIKALATRNFNPHSLMLTTCLFES